MIRIATSRTIWVKRTAVFCVGLAVMLGVLLMAAAKPAHAKTFTVNSTSDASDFAIDGTCDADPRVSVVRCTLRAAIQEANNRISNPGADTIRFSIPPITDPSCNANTGVCTISPASALPLITEALTINGYTQRPCSNNPAPCSKANTAAVGTNAVLLVQLNGANVMSAGLWINASSSVVKGLVINRFGTGIRIGVDNIGAAPTTGNRIEGNFIGTDPSGTLDRSNRGSGVDIAASGSSNSVGGISRAARNLISGNSQDGVSIHSLSATGNQVLGNYIGTDESGTANLGNDWNGVQSRGANTFIGNNTLAGANVIAFNGKDPSFNNGSHGVLITGDNATGNSILRNSIFSNVGMGINLGHLDGRTPNDTGDADTGPNNLQNFPVLTSAETPLFDAPTTIKGRLNSTPDTFFTIHFFSNPSGNEGQKFIDAIGVVTDSSGNASFTFTHPNHVVPVGQTITATATDPNGNTSEFSAPRVVTRGGVIGET